MTVRRAEAASAAAVILGHCLPEPVSIIGASGALGFGLAARLAHAGREVVIGSRDPERAEQAVARARAAVPDGDVSRRRQRRGGGAHASS